MIDQPRVMPQAVPRPNAHAILLLAMAALALQEGALVHTLYSYRVLGRPPELWFRALASGPIFLAVVPYLNARVVRIASRWVPMVMLFVIVTVLGLCLGWLNHLEARYFFGDFLRFLTPWVTFFLCLQAFTTLAFAQGPLALLHYYHFFVVLAVVDACATVVVGYLYPGLHVSNWFLMFGVAWALLDNRRGSLLTLPVLALCIVAAIMSAKRANLFLVAFTFVGSLLYFPVCLRRAPPNLGRTCAALGAAVLFVLMSGSASSRTGLVQSALNTGEEVVEIVTGDYDRSYQFRVNEVANIVDFYHRNTGWLATGLGFGCEIPMRYETSPPTVTPSGNMHHVHKGFWAYLLRNGLLGVALLATFSLTVVCMSFSLNKVDLRVRNQVVVCLVYALGRLVAAYGGNLMLEELDLPVVAALAYGLTVSSGHDSLRSGDHAAANSPYRAYHESGGKCGRAAGGHQRPCSDAGSRCRCRLPCESV